MRRALKAVVMIAIVVAASLLLYGAKGYYDAVRDSGALANRADRLIAANRGAESLGPGRIDQLLMVEDPGFWTHSGVDFSTPGAGMTTMTQSLSKRLAFERFTPGLPKIRQTGYAMGLESRLTKPQIIALWLERADMGRGPSGWMKGFLEASRQVYGRPVGEISEREFLTLVAVPIAPGTYNLRKPDAGLNERVDRIERLIAHQCRPLGLRDVWLEGCAAT